VTADTVILDLGAGTGIFSLLACQFGAKKVYAIEPDNAIELARIMAMANGYGDRIECIQALSTAVTLPEPVDVIIADLRGTLPLYSHHLSTLADAAQRFLKPNGRLIPLQDTLWAAVVEAPELYASYAAPWQENRYGLDLQAALNLTTNTWGAGRVEPQQLLVKPKCWASLNYSPQSNPKLINPDHSGELTWPVLRPGIGHGLLIWFDTTLIPGVGFTNRPGAELAPKVYGSAFFPWSQPVVLAKGDAIAFQIKANLVGEDYIWSWQTQITIPDQSQPVKASFKQSTFLGQPLSTKQLHRQASSFVPTLNETGQIDRLILDLMHNGISLGEIAQQIATQFPLRFKNGQQALTRVGELSQKYSQS
jgi:type I protein arginine methyltransferase